MKQQISAKEQHWRKHINQWAASGDTQPNYCRKHQLNLNQFVYWRSKLKTIKLAAKPTKATGACFIPAIIEAPQPERLSLSLPCGVKIEGISNHSLPLVVKLVEVLAP